jgi:uncharacterized membrane protein YphA (DoxX/SURF4 family)
MSASTTVNPLEHSFDMPAWKGVLSHIAAGIVALLFLSAGIWKALDPFTWSRLLEQLLVPYQISLPSTLLLSVAEILTGVMIIIPRFRRWGGLLGAALLLVFMIYIGANYPKLVGKDCSCFPWVKRTVNPAFFAEDGGMLLAALVAAWLSRPVRHIRAAAMVLGAVVVFAAAGYGFAYSHQSGLKAPDAITVDGKPYSLQHGRIFLFFYDPNCGHCDAAAKGMSKLHWKDDVTVIGIPTREQRFAAAFLRDTGLKAVTSLDLELLKKTFTFGDPPYGVALVNGRQISPVPTYEGSEPEDTLRKVGYIE